LDGRFAAHGLAAKVDSSQLAAWLATAEGSNQDDHSLRALVASERLRLNKAALEAKAAAAGVSVAELQKIQDAEKEAERQQKINDIAAHESQQKALKEAKKTLKRKAGEGLAQEAERQNCDVSEPKIQAAVPSRPPSSSPALAPTPIPSSVRSTESKPATVCQSRCGVRTFLLDWTAALQVASAAASSAVGSDRQHEPKQAIEPSQKSAKKKRSKEQEREVCSPSPASALAPSSSRATFACSNASDPAAPSLFSSCFCIVILFRGAIRRSQRRPQ
jgi:hypothetical protein